MSVQIDAMVLRLVQQVAEQGERLKVLTESRLMAKALETRIAYLERELEQRHASRPEKRINGSR